jgi:hypothetical protein
MLNKNVTSSRKASKSKSTQETQDLILRFGSTKNHTSSLRDSQRTRHLSILSSLPRRPPPRAVKWRRAREWNLLARWGARRTWFRKESHTLVWIHKESYVLDRVDLGHLKVLHFWVSSSNESRNRFWFGSPVGGMFLMFQTYFRFGSNNESSLRDSLRSSSFIFKSSWIEGNWGVIILSKAYRGLNSDQSTINPLLTEINKQGIRMVLVAPGTTNGAMLVFSFLLNQ